MLTLGSLEGYKTESRRGRLQKGYEPNPQEPGGLQLKLVISIDVEEEGLFCRDYRRKPVGVQNVVHLRRIEFISKEFGFPLTLLATYPVVSNTSCQDNLLAWRNDLRAEIGAHLHHWNTPPFEELACPEPVPSELLPMPLLRAKLDSLVSALQQNLEVVPSAFRMGRFDLTMQVSRLLPMYGFRVDSSIVPLRMVAGGPDHFLAPPDPYWLQPCQGYPPILEVPLTMVPIWYGSERFIYRLAQILPREKADFLLLGFRYAAVLGIHPAWYPLASMKLATHFHRHRGGQVLHMFLHSSELSAGSTPQYGHEAAVRHLLRKIRAFLNWLTQTGPAQGVTLSQLYRDEKRTID